MIDLFTFDFLYYLVRSLAVFCIAIAVTRVVMVDILGHIFQMLTEYLSFRRAITSTLEHHKESQKKEDAK